MVEPVSYDFHVASPPLIQQAYWLYALFGLLFLALMFYLYPQALAIQPRFLKPESRYLRKPVIMATSLVTSRLETDQLLEKIKQLIQQKSKPTRLK
jgi:hypothetical protein